jgi:hypothetical protein
MPWLLMYSKIPKSKVKAKHRPMRRLFEQII